MSWSRYRFLFVGVVAVLSFGVLIGCAPNTEPIERGVQTAMTDVVKPAIEKVTNELSTRTAQLQGQGSLINPGYRVQGFASFGPAVTYNFELNAVGLSANIAGATQADAGQAATVPPPAIRPTSQPAAITGPNDEVGKPPEQQ